MALKSTAKALAAKINKQHGEGTVVLASDLHIPRRYTSGSLSLDLSLGGGWPANQWIEIYGEESHGKTAVTLKTLAANQRLDPGFTTLWIASEHYDQDQATALGVDTSRVQLVSTQDMPFAYDTVLEYLSERAVDCVVIDSYPALIPPEEDEKVMDEYTMAEGAKMTNKFFRKVGKAGRRDPLNEQDSPWLGIFINQPRDKMGRTMPGMPPPITTPGGRGKNYAFYARLEVKRADWIEQKTPGKGKSRVGQVIRTRTIKNKGGPPQRVASVEFYFTDAPELGFSRGDYDEAKDVATMAVLFDVIERASSQSAWYSFQGQKWNGMPAVLASLKEDPGLREKVTRSVIEQSERPGDKRTWDEDDIEKANARTVVKRRSA